MSSAVVSTSAALGRPFVFDDRSEPEVYSPFSDSKKPPHTNELLITRVLQSAIKNQKSAIPLITPASRLEIRPALEMVSSGIPELDALTGGLPRGCLTEICGSASSGRSTLMLAALATATGRGEFCVVVDASDALDPYSAAVAGVELDRMLWVRCSEDSPQRERSPRRHRDTEENKIKDSIQTQNKNQVERLEQVLRATDLLLESGGFGLIVLDLADLPQQAARRIPLTTWFRFRRAVENKPTILLAIEQYPIAGSCSSLLLKLGSPINLSGQWEGLAAERRKKICLGEQPTHDFQIVRPTHAQLLTGMNINAELIRSRLDRKPAHSVTFATKTTWAG
jgi:hypothetical protein